MKKLFYFYIIFAIGMVLPEIIQTIKSLAEPTPSVDNHDPFAERDSVRANFCNNPSIENLNEIWGEIVYQHGIKKYDLFMYTWYTAFAESDESGRYTVYRLLTDTIYDKNHYTPNSSMLEFANRIKPILTK